MTAVSELHAASDTLRAAEHPAPHYQPLADWLDAMAVEVGRRSYFWQATGQDADALTTVLYRWPLEVARAVLAEVTV